MVGFVEPRYIITDPLFKGTAFFHNFKLYEQTYPKGIERQDKSCLRLALGLDKQFV